MVSTAARHDSVKVATRAKTSACYFAYRCGTRPSVPLVVPPTLCAHAAMRGRNALDRETTMTDR